MQPLKQDRKVASAGQPGLLAPDTSGMNFYRADPALTDLLRIHLPETLFRHIEPHLDRLGELAEGMTLQLAIGRMVLDPLGVAAEAVALMQNRPMTVGQPGAFVEMTAGQAAEPVEMRFDVAKQLVGQMDAQQIGQRRIGAIKVHAGRVRRDQPGLIDQRCRFVFARCVHLRSALISSHSSRRRLRRPASTGRIECCRSCYR